MNHNFLGFFCLLFAISSLQLITEATSLSNPTKLRLLNGAVTSQGRIALQKDTVGFYVNVDFAYNPDDASDSDADDYDMGAMSLALYTSQTVLSQSCFDFYEYQCSEFDCTPYTSATSRVDLPYFIAHGYSARSIVYLDYGNWALNNDAIIATTCTGNPDYSIGSYRYGVLGLGLNTTQSNYLNGTVFSIQLDRYGDSGTLLFDRNYTITDAASYAASLTASSNFHIDASDTVISIDDTQSTFSGKIIFDLDADAIGFPSSVYQDVLDNLQSANANLFCGTDTYMPQCTYTGKVKHLKSIFITVQNTNIEIPPTVYLQNQTDRHAKIDGTVTLNIRSLDSSETGYSYVTPLYENYMILDQNFLSYYYAEFSQNGDYGSVTIWPIYPDNSDSDGCPVWVYIVSGIGGFFFLSLTICCICGCIKRRRDRRRAANKRVFQTDANINAEDQGSLMNNDQGAAGLPYPAQNNYYYPPPAYSYAQNGGYNNGGYSQQQFQNPPQQVQNPQQQYQNPPHAYGNMPGYTYIPQHGQQESRYPYLPPAQGYQQQGFDQNNQRSE